MEFYTRSLRSSLQNSPDMKRERKISSQPGNSFCSSRL